MAKDLLSWLWSFDALGFCLSFWVPSHHLSRSPWSTIPWHALTGWNGGIPWSFVLATVFSVVPRKTHRDLQGLVLRWDKFVCLWLLQHQARPRSSRPQGVGITLLFAVFVSCVEYSLALVFYIKVLGTLRYSKNQCSKDGKISFSLHFHHFACTLHFHHDHRSWFWLCKYSRSLFLLGPLPLRILMVVFGKCNLPSAYHLSAFS